MARSMQQLMVCLAHGRTDVVHEIVKVGLPDGGADDKGVPLIAWCAYYGDVSAMRVLLAHGAVLESLGVNLDLQGAAFHGHWQLCQFLIEQGAHANHADADTGETPLHAAICRANDPRTERVVRVLLDAGADPNAATLAKRETGSFMRDARTRGETPLHRAAAFGTEATIELLIERGAKLDVRDAHGDTPLSWASWHLRPDAILRRLCFGSHTIHPNRQSTADHGIGWSAMQVDLIGRP